MRFFATITACLALAVGSVFARLPLPEGWRITEVFAIGANQLDDAFGNPNNPLLNATLTCKKKKHPLWWTYHLHGTGWHGVTEKKLKQAAAHGNACMTKWKFHSYTDTECFTNADGSKECTDNVPMWNASVSISTPQPHEHPFEVKPSAIESARADCCAVPPFACHRIDRRHDVAI